MRQRNEWALENALAERTPGFGCHPDVADLEVVGPVLVNW